MTAPSGLRRGLAGLVLIVLLALLARPAAAQDSGAAPDPSVCTIGVNVESLYDLDMAGDSFKASLWIWTLCPASLPRPAIETIAFPTAAQLSRDPVETTVLGDGRTYASRHVVGTFRFNWAMTAYPFDRHVVVIPIEETEYGAGRVVFEPDTAQSFLSRAIRSDLPEWDVSELTLTTRIIAEESDYGFPGEDASHYAVAEVAVTLDRTSLVPFLKLTSGVLAAAFIAFFSFFYDPNDKGSFGGKLGLLVGVLFATLVNMRAADTTLGDIADLTLVTEIHLVTLAFIVGLALLALRDRLHVDDGRTLPHPHWTRLGLFGMAYVVLVVGLIVRAWLS